MVKKIALALCLFTGIIRSGNAQNGLVNDIALQDTGRLGQLTSAKDQINIDSHFSKIKNRKWPEFRFDMFSASLLYNTKLPYGYNDGSLYPSVGLQQQYSLGVSTKWGKFFLRLQPEIVTAANLNPDGLPDDFDKPNYWPRYYEKVANVIDLPGRFGTAPIIKLFAGQSSFRYNTSHLSFGISTENIWWGPGLYHSLVMTNNAPGFLHFTLNTAKPWVTSIGSFEGQVIVGQLENSEEEPMENSNMYARPNYSPKPDKQRLLTGMTLTWQPKWLKNFYIGLANAGYMYKNETQGIVDFLPSTNYWKKSGRPALGSLFMRYVMPTDQAELYFEYGSANKSATLFNIFADSVPSGYVGGVRKLVKLGGKKGYIAFTGEVVYMQMPDARLIWIQTNPGLPSKTSSWYTDSIVRHGYTNKGQMIGSAVGPGSNSQILDVSWIKGTNRIGFQFERVVHNNDYYYYNYFNGLPYQGPNNLYWVDANIALHARWVFKNFTVATQIKSISALNYGWVKFGGDLWQAGAPSDKRNIQVNLSMLYHIPAKK